MRKPNLPVLAVAGIIVTAAAGVGGGFYLAEHQQQSEPAVAAPAPSTAQQAPPPPPLPPLPAGQYLFDVVGSGTLPVSIEVNGSESITLVRQVEGADPFRLVLNRQADNYVGEITDPAGIVCKTDSQKREATNRYTVRADGTHGLVEVLGNPCNSPDPNVPLKFDLVPAPTA